MPAPDRLSWSARAGAALVLLGVAGCGPQGADRAQVDRLEQRVAALEKRLGDRAAPSGRSAGAEVPAAAAPPDTFSYLPGAVAVAHAAPTNPRLLAEVPVDSVGGFVYTGGPLALHDLSDRGVRYAGLTGVELQGWFKATQAGRYQFGEDLHGTLGPSAIVGADCTLEVWLEDRVVGAPQGSLPPPNGTGGEQRLSLVAGADLQPGVYKFRLWSACAPTLPRAARLTGDLLVKAPSDLNLRGYKADDLLHRP